MEEPDKQANGVRRRMQETRNRLHRDVGGLVRDARAVVDWRRNVSRHPWLAVGAAAALGFLIVPRRRRPLNLDADALADLARKQRLVVRVEGEKEKPATLGGTLAATVLGIIGRELAAWLRQQATGALAARSEQRHLRERTRYPNSESE